MAEQESEQESGSSEEKSAQDWKEAITNPDIKGHPSLADFKGIDGLATSYVHQQKLIGADKVVVPGKDATAEDWEKVHTALGRPDAPTGYDFSELQVPEGLPWDERVALGVIDAAHKAGLNQRQLRGVLGRYMELQNEQYQADVNSARETTEQYRAQLKEKYGAAFPAKIDLANRAFAAAAGSPERVEAIRTIALADGTMFGDSPLFVDLFATIAEEGLTEDVLHGEKGGQRMTKTPAEAKEEIARRQRDTGLQAVLADSGHPDHDRELEKDRQLYQMAYPEEAAA
jgi:hypothetical protein